VRKNIFILLVILISIPSLTYGEKPIDVLQQTINRGIAILEDPQYQDTTQKEKQQQKLCATAWQAFDFKEFSKRVLAYNWSDFTPEQREQFVDVFARFLCKYYLTKLQEKYKNEKIIYLSQHLTADYRALVKINVLWKGQEVPVDIRMLKRDATWKVYDVIVLGVSAVNNYRAQFHEILRINSPTQVIGRIKSRIEQQ
jgi:phospholipid transport system substrate-binding protein